MVALGMPHLVVASNPTFWYVTRTAAVAGYLALAVSVVLGQLRTVARRSNEHLSWTVDEAHQFLSILAVVLVAVHLVSLIFTDDPPFTWLNLVIPANEPYRPLAVNIGIFALYGLVAVSLSSWIKRAIPYNLWHVIHYLGIVTFALVTVHGWMSGSDTNEQFMRVIYGASSGAIGLIFALRLFIGPRAAGATAHTR
jgi:methionine sulfoxide reductase heme-binding subunit